MRLNLGVLFFFSLTSLPAFSANFCSTDQPVYHVDLNEVNINPGAKVGDIVGQSELISKKITCSRSALAQLKAQNNKLTDISITIPDKPTVQGGGCHVMESGFPGLGIAWYNYNSGTGVWHCFSNNQAQNRGLFGTRYIKDVIYLVKTGDISTGLFDFNKRFQLYESAGGLDQGLLYEIILSGNTTINAPICKPTIKQSTESYTFPVRDALTQSFLTEGMVVDVTCTGYIENGTKLNYNIASANGVYLQDSNYFGTSVPELGVSIKYKNNIDNNEHNLSPSNNFNVVVNNNKARFLLKFSPYVKNGTGVYPLISNGNFNISIKPVSVSE